MTIGENHESSFFIAMKGEHMQENKNRDRRGKAARIKELKK